MQGDLCWIRLGSHSKEELRDILENWFGYKDIKYCSGIMGVPITWLDKYCPEQFEIVGKINNGPPEPYDFAKPIIDGKIKYKRIAIKRKG